ncbi:MAG: hypothetical protein R2764_08370 [Bacteroidales bacterium]
MQVFDQKALCFFEGRKKSMCFSNGIMLAVNKLFQFFIGRALWGNFLGYLKGLSLKIWIIFAVGIE